MAVIALRASSTEHSALEGLKVFLYQKQATSAPLYYTVAITEISAKLTDLNMKQQAVLTLCTLISNAQGVEPEETFAVLSVKQHVTGHEQSSQLYKRQLIRVSL